MKSRNLISEIIIFSIRLYQKILSPILRHWLQCRFYPTCSEYAILCIKKYGLKVGLERSYRRLVRCRPENLDSCIDFP